MFSTTRRFGLQSWTRTFVRTGRRWEDSININLKHVVWKGVDCIFVTQATNQWRVHAHTINKLQIQYNVEDFLSTKWKTVVFSRIFLPLQASHRKVALIKRTWTKHQSSKSGTYVRWSMYCVGCGFRPWHRNKQQDVGSHCRLKSLLNQSYPFMNLHFFSRSASSIFHLFIFSGLNWQWPLLC